MAHHLPDTFLRCVVTKNFRDADTASNAALLDTEESNKLSRFLLAEDRRDYAAAHALLRQTLTEVTPQIDPAEWRFERTPRGKPFLPPAQAGVPPIRFSLAHTRGLVACLVSRGAEVGVDVEAPSQAVHVDSLMRDVCSVDEQEQIRSTTPAARAGRFLDFWMLKEAYLKALGVGITGVLDQVSFDLRTPKVIRASIPGQAAGRWWFTLIGCSPVLRIGAAIATDSHDDPVLDAAVLDAASSPPKLSPLTTCASTPATKLGNNSLS